MSALNIIGLALDADMQQRMNSNINNDSNSNSNGSSNIELEMEMSESEMTSVMDSYIWLLKECNRNRSSHLYSFVEDALRGMSPLLLECEWHNCSCMHINFRNRSLEYEYQNKNNKKALESSDEILASIHSNLLHSREIGYRLSSNQRLQMDCEMQEMEEMEEIEEIAQEIMDENENGSVTHVTPDIIDRHTKYCRELMRNKRQLFSNHRNDIQSKPKNTKTNSSKFVTEVCDNNSNSNSNSNSDSNENAIKFSFGIKFYYSSQYENDDRIDKCYNGGTYQYRFWFVHKKYEDIKAEVMNLESSVNVTIGNWTLMIGRCRKWMSTQFIRELDSGIYCVDYDIIEESPVLDRHLQSLLLYTDFTKLSTLFSSGFRRLYDTETDDDIKGRHENFREWASNLVVMVHCFGTRMCDEKEISVMYHGISIEMTFHQTFAVFCSPTSMTDGLCMSLSFVCASIHFSLLCLALPLLCLYNRYQYRHQLRKDWNCISY